MRNHEHPALIRGKTLNKSLSAKPMRAPRVALLMEQALGHVTYAQNLNVCLGPEAALDVQWIHIPFGTQRRRVPWALRGSVKAMAALRRHGGPSAYDAVFIHTQTIGLLSPVLLRNTPVVLSLDATPIGFDRIGSEYGHHARFGSLTERLKRAWYSEMFRRARALTTWSEWAKASLVEDYGVDPLRIEVIPPGVDLNLFEFGRLRTLTDPSSRPRILFVGGDFGRKGGPLLLECMRHGLANLCELDLVTQVDVPATPGVRVHRDLGPNDPRLLALYRDADIFALPTRADCWALVLGEAMASGLPVVSTAVGAQAEAVADGDSGILVPPNDLQALGRALRHLAEDPQLRLRMGRQGRAIVEARFDGRINARRLADLLTRAAAA